MRLEKTFRIDASGQRVTDGYAFTCPGCGRWHAVPVGDGPGPRWTFNGDVDRPTFSPSLLVKGIKDPWGPAFDKTPTVCHSFIRDGRIEFLGDCTHGLAGQTVDLPDVRSD